MRPASVALIAGSLLALAGFGLVIAARPKAPVEADPIHPITEIMRSEADALASTNAPTFDVIDTEGDRLDLKKLTATGPVFLIFIMDACPCSIEAEPYFQRLYDGFKGKVQFVGITDGDLAAGKEWKAHFQMTYPMISNPKKDLMNQFGAKHSAYTALIGQGGKIVQLWPGFDQEMLGDIEAKLAAEAHLPNPKLNFSDAPKKPTSGCVF